MRREPTVLILDGVDEFLMNHPRLGISDLRQMLSSISSECFANTRLVVFLGVRSSQPGLSTITSEQGQAHEILRLTVAQAGAHFPGTQEWVRSVRNPELKKLLLTPLLLAQLDPQAGGSLVDGTSTRAGIIQVALTKIVTSSGLCELADERGHLTEPSQWIYALMFIAWRMFSRFRGEIALSVLVGEAKEMQTAWTQHLNESGQTEAAASLLGGLDLLCNRTTCEVLARRTILYPTGQGEVRFTHREWQDFLTAAYLAECVSLRYVDELGHLGFNVSIFVTAGELLRAQQIDADLVRAVLERTRQTSEHLITANFCALLGNTRTPMSGPAITLVLGGLSTMAPISRLVTVTGFGHRILSDAPDDTSSLDLRARYTAAMRELLDTPSIYGCAIARSLAWCHLQAFQKLFGIDGPSETRSAFSATSRRPLLW
jgi:hypothetical protein